MLTQTLSPVNTTAQKVDFGKGMFSGEMERLFLAAQKIFDLTPSQAEKFARQAATDAGEVLKKVNMGVKVGKISDDGKATIKLAASQKGFTVTPALCLARAIEWSQDAFKNQVDFIETKWVLNETVRAWVNTLD